MLMYSACLIKTTCAHAWFLCLLVHILYQFRLENVKMKRAIAIYKLIADKS